MKRIFDPVHHFIELDDAEVTLLNVAPVQRLRRLRQLGLAYLAFPAAEHSRFGHALGALAMGDRIVQALRAHDDGYFSSESDYLAQRRLLRASLLLHDVGHGPFSHACEEVLGMRHELRTEQIIALPEIEDALDRIGVDPEQVLALIVGDPLSPYPVLRELVSGPNLDADRMDYLLRDAYFTGVGNGRYDTDQLVASLRVLDRFGKPVLGVDARGLVALESFVLARYMMFSTVYFHHTTRQFERILHDALRFVWTDPRALDSIEEFLQWDDFRVLESFRFATDEAARAVRDRDTLYALVAEFNAEGDLATFETCQRALRERFGDAVWSDTQEQLMHRLPLVLDGHKPTVFVRTRFETIDAREASDLIARVTGKAYWRKLFVEKSRADVEEARLLCRAAIADRSLALFDAPTP
ncbi:MAG: HD domain-containing protein [Candidatus Eremiobacteraeota bacterium]|nr:HD domain-containing protein [Candidatus Eremiobacteraeota bacterium]